MFGSVTTYTATKFRHTAKGHNIIAPHSAHQIPQDIENKNVPLAAPEVQESERSGSTSVPIFYGVPAQNSGNEADSVPVSQITAPVQVPVIDNNENAIPPVNNETEENNNENGISDSIIWNEETILAKAREIMNVVSTMTSAEKQEYLGITNNNFSNDVFRSKLLLLYRGKQARH